MSDFNLQSLTILFQDETVYRLKSDFPIVETNNILEPQIENVAIKIKSKPNVNLQKVDAEVVVKISEAVEQQNMAVELIEKNTKHKVNLIMVSIKLSPEMEGFLQKIMDAIGYKAEQYVVVNSFGELFNFEFEYMILFGMRHKSLNFIPYQITPFNSYKCLLADSIEAIKVDKSLKAILWKNLQEMFGV